MDDLTYIKNRDSETLHIVENGGVKYHSFIFEDINIEDKDFQI